jgi:hypothetical protein
MAINVNTVYRTVLLILNKEQRGYMTPDEFNKIASQVQLEIFEQYFYDLNQFSRLPGNSTEYSDMVDILEEKISIFEKTAQPTYSANHFVEPTDLYRLGTVIYNGSEAEHVNKNEYLYITSSPLSKPTNDFPIYTRDSSGIKIYTASELNNPTGITFNYIKTPADVVWNFTIPSGQNYYEYSSSGSTDFEIHASDQTEVVLKILLYAGVVIKDPSIVQAAAAQSQKQEINQKS